MNDLESLKADLDATRNRLAEVEAQQRRRFRWGALAVVVVLVAVPAWSQLVTFSPNTPAIASEVNANFAQLKAWIELKVGPVGTNTVTLSAPLVGNNVVTGVNIASGTVSAGNIAPNTLTAATLGSGIISNANLNAELACPDATARATFGGCVFFRPSSGGPYVYSFTQAAAACRTEGARLCLYHEISAYQAAGLDRCAYGWVGDRSDNSNAYRVLPKQVADVSCGSAGLNGGVVPMSTLNGAWCCKD